MFEDDLRETFARKEALTAPAGPVRAAINQATVRRRRRRLVVRAAGAALAVVAAVSVPVVARGLAAAPSLPSVLAAPAKLNGLRQAAGDGLTLDTGAVPLIEMVAVLGEMRGADAVGIGWSFRSTMTDRDGRVRLNPELSANLFDAARPG